MEEEKFRDDLIGKMLKKSTRGLPNPDFDNQMMMLIEADVAYKKEVAAQLKTSLRFFIGAIVVGLALALVMLFGEAFMAYHHKTIIILMVLIMSVGTVLNVGNYRRILKMY